MTGANGDAIEQYLDDLVTELAGRPPREIREMLAEAEAHLRDDAAAATARGVPEHLAAEQAVAHFGPARGVARAERGRGRQSARAVLAQLSRTGVLIGAIGAIAVGTSGVIALLIRLAGGPGALVDVAPGQSLSAADCARWMSLRPAAATCRAAAVADWADETVIYRIALGVLGILALLVWRFVFTQRRPTLLVRTVGDTLAAAAFGLAAAVTLGLGIDATLVGGGAGQWFSATPVALGAAALFGKRFLDDVRTPLPA